MADELSIQVGLTYSKNSASFQKLPAADSDIDVSGDAVQSGVQSIGTSAEDIVKGDITTTGYVMVHNLDGTNYIEVGYDDTGFKPVVKLLPGEYAVFRSAQATLQAKADTGACLMEYVLIEA